MIDYQNSSLHTERLVLRAPRPEDYAAWKETQLSCTAPQSAYDNGALSAGALTEEAYAERLARYEKWAADDFVYVFWAFRAEDGVYIGSADVRVVIREEYGWGFLGYAVSNIYWGNGYAKEIIRGACTLAVDSLGLHRLEAHVDPDNMRSAGAALGAGMMDEGVRPRLAFEDGVWCDYRVFSHTAE